MTEEASIVLKDRAAERARELLARDGAKGRMLRVSLMRTHCMGGRGYAYGLAPEEAPADADLVEEVGGLRVVLREEDLPRLRGAVIDYVEAFQESGFAVENPNAVGKCHCGHHDLFE